MKKKYVFAFFILILLLFEVKAQEQTLQKLPLTDMSSFKPQAGNWMIVGKVVMNPNVDIHHVEMTEEIPSGKKKKSKNKVEEVAKPEAVVFDAGQGILLNMNDEAKKDNLLTDWEHGDIQLEFDVMLPKGSNSGIYLQGRYEIQLYDSWDMKNAKFSDMGGIFRNWEEGPDKSYMGKAPLSNASKAPGLWQNIKLLFKAPRFNEKGEKIENARFVYVDLNGVRIHDNIEVPLPTGGPVENNEVAKGPIMIQGDHGTVAIRNFRYKLMNESGVQLSKMDYKVFFGEFLAVDEFYNLSPTKTGQTELSCYASGEENKFAIVFNGKLTIPERDNYEFSLSSGGGAKLLIDGKELGEIQRGDGSGWIRNSMELTSGGHSIEIIYYKTASWMQPRLGLFVSTNTTYSKPLHAFESYPIDINNISQVIVHVGSEPKLLRAFLDYKGDESQRITHSIGVGDPSGMNYVYDLKNGNLACVWKGEFVNATSMWHDRGDGSFNPIGAVEYIVNNQQLSTLETESTPFPTISNENELTPKGYLLEEKNGRPIFLYSYKGIEVQDHIYPSDEGKTITREINFNKTLEQEKLYFKMAEGSDIFQMSDGSYVINDHQFYLKVVNGGVPTIREVDGLKELLLPANGTQIKYSIIW